MDVNKAHDAIYRWTRRLGSGIVEAVPEPMTEPFLRAFAYAAAANGDPLPALAEEAADVLRRRQ